MINNTPKPVAVRRFDITAEDSQLQTAVVEIYTPVKQGDEEQDPWIANVKIQHPLQTVDRAIYGIDSYQCMKLALHYADVEIEVLQGTYGSAITFCASADILQI